MELLKGENSNLIPGVTSSISSMGVFGAVAGGTIAAVSNSVRVARGELSGPESVSNVAKETVGTGLCTAAGMAAMRAIGSGGIVGLIAFFCSRRHRQDHLGFGGFKLQSNLGEGRNH